MEAVRQDQLEYTMAFDKFANAYSELSLEDKKIILDGVESNPLKFIKELTANIKENYFEDCQKQNRCPICLSELDIIKEYNLSNYGSSVAREDYCVAVCPNCGEV